MSAGTWKDSALTRPKAVSVIGAKKTAPFILNDLQLYAPKRLALRCNLGWIERGSLTPLRQGGVAGGSGVETPGKLLSFHLMPERKAFAIQVDRVVASGSNTDEHHEERRVADPVRCRNGYRLRY
jgi:hypothetical protein